MKKLITRAATTLASTTIAAALSLSATAQAKPGDFVVTESLGGVFAVDPTTYATRTLAAPAGRIVNAVTMGASNYYAYTIETSAGFDRLAQVSPLSGNTYGFASLPGTYKNAGVAIDVDGSALVVGHHGHLFRVDANKKVSTICSGLGAANAIAVDGDTGHYVVGALGKLLQVDRRSKAVSTVGTLDGQVTGVAVHPHTGNYVVTSTGRYTIQIMNRSGRALYWWTSGPNNAVAVDHATGNIVAVGQNRLYRFNKKLQAFATRILPSRIMMTGVAIYGSRKLSGVGSLKKGSVFTVNLKFIDSPNAPYSGALASRGVRPGIPASGRTININFLDELVYISSSGKLEGLYTLGINGTLSGGGRGQVQIALPQMMPRNANLYFVANAVNRSKPGGLDFGNTVVIPVQ